MVGALWMLAWLGVSATWQLRSFWTPENLMATAFDRNATLPPGFTAGTCTGLALYLAIYSLLGAIFAAVLRDRVARPRVMLLSVLFSLAWYYFSFRWAFKFTMPLVALLHVERSTMLGHLVYGTMLGRYPLYVQRLVGTAEVVAPAATEPVEATPALAAEGAAEGAPVAGERADAVRALVAEGTGDAAPAAVAETAEEGAAWPAAEETAEAALAPVAEGTAEAAPAAVVEAAAEAVPAQVAEAAAAEAVEERQDAPRSEP